MEDQNDYVEKYFNLFSIDNYWYIKHIKRTLEETKHV